jgi:hypothetical protein
LILDILENDSKKKIFIIIKMSLRVFATIASKAPQVFRTIWGAIKASPTLSSLKDALIG